MSRTINESLPSSARGPHSARTTQGAVLGKRIEQAVISTHRWIGIGICIVMLVWFVSGWVMAYVRFPAMPPDEKLEVLPPIAWDQVSIAPGEALAIAGFSDLPLELRLEMSGSQPVYRIVDWHKGRHAVSAVTGKVIERVSAEQAVSIVRTQLGQPQATLRAASIDSDQWTITSSWNQDRPFHLVQLNDEASRHLYVSVATGEIVLDTGRTERVLNWFGAIPHWLYFEFLRHYNREPLWRWTVYILAGAGIVVALSGLFLGVRRARWRLRYANGDWTPFAGWMRWHHVLGLLGGILLAAWMISGFWTMYPGGILKPRGISQLEYEQYRGAGDANALSREQWRRLAPARLSQTRRVSFTRVGGQPLLILEALGAAPVVLNGQTGTATTFTADTISAAARGLAPNGRILRTTLLRDGDEYWHSGFRYRKVPIWRVEVDDRAGSWYHMDPDTGEISGVVDRDARINRWTVVAAHNADFHRLITTSRPLWDVVMFLVTIPAALLAATALVIGYRRLARMPALAGSVVSRAARCEVSRGADGLRRSEGARSDEILVAFASQTGTAELIAGKVASALQRALHKPRLVQLGDLDAASLGEHARAIFVVSTTGDGDPPDNAVPFRRHAMCTVQDLTGLRYGMLSLGDYGYREFCAFGNQLDGWLRSGGAVPMFESVRVDDLSSEALDQWGRELAILTGSFEDFTVRRKPYERWRLAARRLINPGSCGGEVYHLEFVPVAAAADWQAGDIAQLVIGRSWAQYDPRARATTEREYSLASVPTNGSAHLLVRKVVDEHGRTGLGSGYLTSQLAVGDEIPMRIRSNRAFHGPDTDLPMILIGNGTGLAGLRAHLLRRELLQHRRNWLLFGERNARTDAFFAEDLQRWIRTGHLERVNLVYSRDQEQRRYVQHAVREAAAEIREWLANGADIYVCGSLAGMAGGVTNELIAIVGEPELDALVRAGRYRRDVY